MQNYINQKGLKKLMSNLIGSYMENGYILVPTTMLMTNHEYLVYLENEEETLALGYVRNRELTFDPYSKLEIVTYKVNERGWPVAETINVVETLYYKRENGTHLVGEFGEKANQKAIERRERRYKLEREEKAFTASKRGLNIPGLKRQEVKIERLPRGYKLTGLKNGTEAFLSFPKAS